LFKIRANFFEGDFQPLISKLIERVPKQSLELFSLFSTQFTLISNPWSILGRFLRCYRIYLQSESSAEYIRILSFLPWKYPIPLTPRVEHIREIMEKFLESDDSATIIECYHGLAEIYDPNREIPIEMIVRHLRDEEVAGAALQMTSKAPSLPVSSTLVHSLINAGLNNADATSLLLKSAHNPEIAAILLRQPKWMKYGLPTFVWTLKVCMRICTNPEIGKQFQEIQETEVMIGRVVNSGELDAIEKLPVFLKTIEFSQMKSLEASGFFEQLREKIETAHNSIPFLALLVAFARVGYTRAFVGFAELLQGLLQEGQEGWHEAIRAVSVMSAYPKCAARFRALRVDRTVAEQRGHKEDAKYIKKFLENVRNVE
jgi:hypothetical protein